MITDKDIQKLLSAFLPVFATKEDLHQFKDEIRGEMKENRIDILGKVDAAYTEIQAVRQEQAAHQLQHEDINIKIKKLASSKLIN